MKAIVCEMCSSNDVVKENGMYVCQSCNTKYAPEEAKKLLVEVASPVRIDNSEKLDNLYAVARRAKEDGNSEEAAKYYDMILVENPSDWEASFYSVYYKSMGTNITSIAINAENVSSRAITVLEMIKKGDEPEKSKLEHVTEIQLKCATIAAMMFLAAKNHYNGISATVQHKFVQGYINSAFSCVTLHYGLGDRIAELWPDNEAFGKVAMKSWKEGVSIHKQIYQHLRDKAGNLNRMNTYVAKIKKYDQSYELGTLNAGSSGGCYVATAVYGSYDCPQVWTLRRYRDQKLAKTPAGRLFIRAYYAASPKVVELFGEKKWFNKIWRNRLDAFVVQLRAKGFSGEPYLDR